MNIDTVVQVLSVMAFEIFDVRHNLELEAMLNHAIAEEKKILHHSTLETGQIICFFFHFSPSYQTQKSILEWGHCTSTFHQRVAVKRVPCIDVRDWMATLNHKATNTWIHSISYFSFSYFCFIHLLPNFITEAQVRKYDVKACNNYTKPRAEKSNTIYHYYHLLGFIIQNALLHPRIFSGPKQNRMLHEIK